MFVYVYRSEDVPLLKRLVRGEEGGQETLNVETGFSWSVGKEMCTSDGEDSVTSDEGTVVFPYNSS